MTIDFAHTLEHYQQVADGLVAERNDPEAHREAKNWGDAPRPLAERDAEITWELREARTMLRAGNSETAIAERLDRALELLSPGHA